MKTRIFLLATLLSALFFIGCSSNEKADVNATSQTITADDAVADSEIDATVDDVSLIAEDQFSVQQGLTAKTSTPFKSILPVCATVTTVLTNDTYTKTIDFGTDGCALPNGNIVKGKIIVSFSKTTTTSSRAISYSLVGFYHNGNLIEGNKTITREIKSTDLLAALHPVATHSIDVKITFADGKVYTRTGTRVREMIEGYDTLGDWEDNVFLVWGNHITTFPNGNQFTATIKTPLRIVLSCKKPFPVSGVITFTKNDKEATLDYGNGDCDVLATLTINGVTKEIKLRK
jgi:outer membrane murein-binding lipoprotein Lpp